VRYFSSLLLSCHCIGCIFPCDNDIDIVTSFLLLYCCMQSVSSDVKWVDGGRPLFKFGLSLLSTIYTKVFFIIVNCDQIVVSSY